MAPFKQGDKIKIKCLTDVDTKELAEDDTFHIVGRTGVVTQPAINDYYECIIELDMPYNEDLIMCYGNPPQLAMLYRDLEVILMGNTPIQTTHTNIHYPSDWLVQGGPPFESVGAPPAETEVTDEDMMSSLAVVWSDEQWKLIYGTAEYSEPVIVMESTNIQDVLTYFKEYMEGLKYMADHEFDK